MTYRSGDYDEDDVLGVAAVIGGLVALVGAAVVAGKALYDRIAQRTDGESDTDAGNDGYPGGGGDRRVCPRSGVFCQ